MQRKYGGGTDDVFVTKFNSSGSALVYSTFLGGSEYEYGYGIAADSSGNAYVTGTTTSTDFPTMNPLQSSSAGSWDIFLTKLDAEGSTLVYSTYLGGGDVDIGNAIAVDSSGNAYLTGQTGSNNFPITPGAVQPVCGGCSNYRDAFVARINTAGSGLVYSTYLGGSDNDWANGIAVDGLGNAYVTGASASTDFPTMNPLQSSNAGKYDVFVTKFNAAGSAFVYSTYLGGNNVDNAYAIAVDASGSVYVTGQTASTNFPTLNPLQPASGGQNDAFVTKLNSSGSALVYSTYLGGSNDDVGYGIAVDSSGNACVTGTTISIDFPTMNPLQASNAGNYDVFVAKLNPLASAFLYSTYFGGNSDDEGHGVTVDNSSNVYITGTTASANFPTMNPFQSALGGGYDVFVAKLTAIPVVTLSPSSLNFGSQKVGTTSNPQNVTLTNSGDADLNISSIVTTGDFSQTNTCPVGGNLAAGSYCTIAVTFTPTAPGTRNGALTITDNAPGSPQSVPLTGVGLQGAVTLTPPSLNFGNQTVGITSSPQISTLTNTGNGTLTITSITVTGANSGDFAEKNNCGTSVPAGGSCNISVTFTPTGTGSRNAAVSITDDAPDSPQSIPLTGVGVLPAVTFSPTGLTFPDQTVFTSSPAQKLTLTNTGLGILKITSGRFSGPFSGNTDCGKTLDPGASCTTNIVFKPKTKGQQSGSVTVTDNAPDNPQTVPLTGIGTYVQFSPTKLNFGTQPIGTTSLPKYINLTNKGSEVVNISGISITGANAGDFAQQNNCGTSVASGASCKIKVRFTPSQQGKRTAAVSISDDGGGSPQTVPLTGTGTP